MGERGIRFLNRAAYGAAFIFVSFFAIKVWNNPGYSDFQVYYRTSELLQRGNWILIYSLDFQPSIFQYTPITFPAFYPLAWLDPVVSREVWFFLSVLAYALGIALVSRLLQRHEQNHRLWVPVALLFSLRFILDSLSIGQVSGFMFFGLCLALYAWIEGHPRMAAGGALIAGSTKLGFFVLIPMFFLRGWGFGLSSVKAAILFSIGASLVVPLWYGIGHIGEMATVWTEGLIAVLKDDTSNLFDFSHAGSQAFRSMLIRLTKGGWLEKSTAMMIWAAVTSLSYLVIAGVAMTRRFESFQAKGLIFSLFVMSYIVFMPFTFKYSVSFLFIPLVFVLPTLTTTLLKWTLGATGLLLSFTSPDVIGYEAASFLQTHSLPGMMLLCWFALTATQAYRHSTPRWENHAVGAPSVAL